MDYKKKKLEKLRMFQINFVTIAHKIQYFINSYYLVFLSDTAGTSISEKNK